MSVEAKQAKQVVIDEIKGKLDKAASAVIVDYIGITVEQADAMRKKLREADVDYTVYKNTLMKRAVDGTDYEVFKDILEGPSALAVSYDDATAPVRVINEAIKDYGKMEFKGGMIEGEYMDSEAIKRVADIPSREVLLSKFIGSIQSPVSALVRTFKAIADAQAE